MGRKTINSFERVRVFGEEYSVKTPSSIPPIYVLKKEGTVCHIDMRDMEWIVKLASKYRRYEELHTPLSTNISGIIIHPDETLQQYDLNLIDISELTDLIMKVTYLKSKSTNQVYVLAIRREDLNVSYRQYVMLKKKLQSHILSSLTQFLLSIPQELNLIQKSHQP